MHIEVNIFPDHFSISRDKWQDEMQMLQARITDYILDATINPTAAAIGNFTLLANDDSGIIVATIDIRRN